VITAARAARTIRIVRLSFIGYGVLLIFVLYRVPATARQPISPSFELAISVIALMSLAFGFSGPRLMKRIAEKSGRRVQLPAPEKQWMSRGLLSMASFMACALYGVVLHFTGAHLSSVILVAAGLLALILWRPEPLPATEDEAIRRY
jgi:hypothetical protein